MPNESGTSGQLRKYRPSLSFGDVVCVKCGGIPAEFDETASHNLFGRPDEDGQTRGYLMLRAYCHGQHEDVRIAFKAMRDNIGEKIEVFVDDQPEPLPQLEDSRKNLPSIQSKEEKGAP